MTSVPSRQPAEPAATELLTGILESVAVGICLWDANLRLVTWNSAYPKITGVPVDVLKPGARLATVLDASPPLLDDPRTGDEIEAMALKGLAAKGTLDLDRVHADGRVISVNYHAFSAGGWIAIYTDVTERRRDVRLLRDSERELKAQNASLDAALDSMPYGFSIWNGDLRLVLTNNRYCEIYNLPPDRVREGMTLMEICEVTVAAGNHPGKTAKDLFQTYRDRLIETSDPSAPIIHEKQIRDRVIKTTYTRAPEIGWVITHEDVTEQIDQLNAIRDSEVELKRQNIRFEAAVNNMSQGLCMFDANQRLVICNNNYATIYGLPPELIRPGTYLREILAYRIDHGMHPIGGKDAYIKRRLELVTNRKSDTDIVELQNGRVISVLHQPMHDGGWVSTHQDITEQRRTEARIRHMARHDALTDLPNRVMFRELMEEAEDRIKRRETLAVLCVDLDHFKSVNDTLGHAIGDDVLKGVAGRLRDTCRDGDVVARLGGDEFALLHGQLRHPADAAVLADRIVKTMGEPFDIQGHNILIGASVGIAVAPGDGLDAETLLKNADLALYRAKGEGRGTYHFFEQGMDAALQERRILEMGLRQAIAKNELRLVFQPLFNLKENRICGLEALLRWYHPERGTIAPSEFIPIAEETGLIVPIGEWVLHEACATAATWPDHISVAVNLSAVQFKNRNLLHHVTSALENAKLRPDRLEIEITESLLLADNDLTLHTLHQLRKLGVRVSMDDFGTGYSSLSYLRSFPFDKIKIDQSFVKDLSSKDDNLAIVRAVIGLGRSLGISTTAEGVETEAQLDLVREQGCTEVQGFFFSPPLPASAIAQLFADQTPMADRMGPKKAAS